jgi:hypothetical protein
MASGIPAAMDLNRVDFARMDRMFVSGHGPDNPRSEYWREVGHWLEGFELRLKRVREIGPKLRYRNLRNLGRIIEGRGEPLQNRVIDYQRQASLLNGDKNVAMLCGDQLWFFGMTYLGGNKWRDNRISLITEEGYTSPMQKSFTEFTGYVREVKIYEIKDLRLVNGQLSYKKTRTFSMEELHEGKDVLISQNGN